MEDLHRDKLFDGADAWAMWELGKTELGDLRRTNRLVQVVSALAANPASSLPDAFESWADTKAAYRFLENDEIEPAATISGHRQSTLQRCGKYPTILAVQDTTMLNFSGHPATRGLGSIGPKRGHQQGDPQGFLVHSCLAVTPEGVPLGLLGQKQWVRGEGGGDSEGEQRSDTSSAAADEKESLRWPEMMKTSTMGLPAGTKVITVADREADIYDMFSTALQLNQDALVRARHNRHLAGTKDRLWDVLEQAKVAGKVVVEVPRTERRPPRTATLELRSAWVRLPSPKVVTPITLSAVLAREVPLETADRLQRAVAVYSVVAWRLLYLTYMARTEPKAPCTRFLSDSEWQALYCHINRTNQLPDSPPSMETAIVWIARMGGFLARKRDGHPGVKVIWRGWRRLAHMSAMWEILRPKA